MKRSFGTVVRLGTLALALSACGSDGGSDKKLVHRAPVPDNTFKPAALESTISDLVDAIGETAPRDLQLAVLLKNFVGYWEPVKLGANRAIGELDVSGVVLAPSEETEDEALAQQILQIQEQREGAYDGLAIAPLKSVLAEEIDATVDAGIPVVTLDSDLESKRSLYVGTINYEAGKTSGQTLTDMLEAKGARGSVVVLGQVTESWPDGYSRTQGAKDVLSAAGYDVIQHQITWDATSDVTDSEALATLLAEADPPIVGMVCMFSPTHRLAMAAELAGKTAEDVTIVGFDFGTETLDYMRSGLVQATHAQRQYYMGYLVPYVLYGFSVLGERKTLDILAPHMVDAHRFDAGLDVVRADQLDEYNAFLDSLGIGG